MKILVTGGAGFIGSHVVDAYVADGHEVVVVDDLSSGKRENINPGAKFYELSILDDGLREVFGSEMPEVVNHHAAQISVSASVQDPVFDAEVNVLGSLKVIECALEFGVKNFIFASTGGALYGEPEYLPCDENHRIAPLSPYGVAKFAVERYLYTYSITKGLRYVALRYSNVYGPRQDPHGEAGVVAIFARRMLDGREVIIYGDGEQTRDFVYVGDVVKANQVVLERCMESPGLHVNIGTGQETSVNDIFNILAEFVAYGREPIHEPPRPGDVYRIALDAGKAASTLQWRPEISIREGLKLTADWFKSHPV